MSIDPTVAGSPAFIERVKNILLKPQTEFDRIATEPADVNKLYTGYLLPLAALSAICLAVGMIVFGYGVPGLAMMRFTPVQGVVSGVFQFIMAFVGAYVLALIVNALAPNFGSVKDQGRAHQLTVYSYTASLLASVVMIYPPLGMLGILGLYSLVLMFIGLPRLMKTPDDKRIGYFITIIVVSIVVFLVIGVVSGAVRTALGAGMPGVTMGQVGAPAVSAPSTQADSSITINGQSVNVSELEKLGQAYASGAAANGGAAAVDPNQLQAMLPHALPGGFTQTSVSNGTSGAMGMNASQAEGVYQRGDARMTVTIVHMGAMGGLASMLGQAGVQESRQDADGYHRTQTVEGRVVTEEVSRASNHASYAVIGRGVAVTAEGNGVSAEEARAAVEAVGLPRLEAMAAAQPQTSANN